MRSVTIRGLAAVLFGIVAICIAANGDGPLHWSAALCFALASFWTGTVALRDRRRIDAQGS